MILTTYCRIHQSTIILDRLLWIRESLAAIARAELDVQSHLYLHIHARTVNLFDQATGSGRNVALVVSPSKI
jgi:hypothetical protein